MSDTLHTNININKHSQLLHLKGIVFYKDTVSTEHVITPKKYLGYSKYILLQSKSEIRENLLVVD